MSPGDTEIAQGSARTFVHDLNQAWLNGKFRELARYFDDEMVILLPDTGKRVRGKHACVKSYEQFMASSKVHEYRESGFAVDIWGRIAIVAYKFRIKYEWNEKTSTDTGRDVFVLVREREKWKAVWRTLIADRV